MSIMIDKYIQELTEGNKSQNLISRRATESDIIEHIKDSQILSAVLDLKGRQVLDMGSGQGLPGIPLAIGEPEGQFVLVESDLKKSQFLKRLVTKLGLENVKIIRSRVEELARSNEYRGQFDMVTSRAVASLPTILEWGLPFLKIGGTLVAWKGAKVEEEIGESGKALDTLGGILLMVKNYEVRDKIRYLVFISKVRECPPQFPRKGGIAKKRPLR